MKIVTVPSGSPINLTGWELRAYYTPVHKCDHCEHVDYDRQSGDTVEVPLRIVNLYAGGIEVDEGRCLRPCIVRVQGTAPGAGIQTLAFYRL